MTKSTFKALLALPLLTVALTGFSISATAQPPQGTPGAQNQAGANGQGQARGSQTRGKSMVQNGRGAIQGNLKTSQHIYYAGDDLEISVQFPRGSNLLRDGEAEAHIVIYSFDGNLITVPVDSTIGAASRKFFDIDAVDIATLPEGQYQLGLVLTVPGGDPAQLDDWYSGFRALLDTEAVYVSGGAVDGDDDNDGEWDDDLDGDGIAGEEEDEDDDDVVVVITP